MKKLIAMIAMAGLLAATGCASRENRGGTSDNQNNSSFDPGVTSTIDSAKSGSMNSTTNSASGSGTAPDSSSPSSGSGSSDNNSSDSSSNSGSK